MEKRENNKYRFKTSCKKMKVKWIGKTSSFMMTNGKIYEVLSIEKDWYRVINDTWEDYLYPPDKFEIIDE